MVSLELLDRLAPVHRVPLERQDSKVLLDRAALLVSKGRVVLVAYRVGPEHLDQLGPKEQLDQLDKLDHKELVGSRVPRDLRERLEALGHLEHRVSQDLKELLVQVDQLEIQVTQGLWASLAVVDLQDQRAHQDLLEQVGSKDLRDPKALLEVLDPVDQRVLQDLQVQLDLLELLGELDSQDPVGHPVIRDNRDFQDLRVQLVNPVHKVRPVPLDNRDQLVQPEHLVEPVPLGKVVSQGPRVLLGHRVLLVLLVPLDQRETPDPLVELEQRDLQAQLETKEQLVRKDSLVLQDSKEPLANQDPRVVRVFKDLPALLVQKVLWEVLGNQDRLELRVHQVLRVLLVNRELQVLRVLKGQRVRLEALDPQGNKDHLDQLELEG